MGECICGRCLAWGREPGEVPVLQLHGELWRKGPSAHTDKGKRGQTLATGWTRGPPAFPEARAHSSLICQVCVATVRWSYMVRQVLPGLTHSSLSSNLPLKQRRIRDKMLMGEENQGHRVDYNQFCRRGRSLPNFLIMYFHEMHLHAFDQLTQLPRLPSAVVSANSFGSHFPMLSLKFSKLKHLDEPRKSCKWYPYCIYSK